MRGFVVRFDEPRADDPSVVGTKGHHLARLLRAGFPVPPGFVVGTDALRAADGAGGGPGMPEPVRDEILRAYRRLVAPPPAGTPVAVAVRSSATAEDLRGASFAGAYDTYLNVRDEPGVLAAVTRCWVSPRAERAARELARHSVDAAAVDLAVVIQRMVPAACSGVLFTANPVTGDRTEAVINACWGLGRAVVDGLVTPDTVVVDKATRRVRQIVVGDKAVMTVPDRAGTTEVPVAADRRAARVLDAATIAALVDTGCAVEDLFGRPQDIEWALADGRLYLLQARPVTGLPGGPTLDGPALYGPTLDGPTLDGAAQDDPAQDEVPGDDVWPAFDELPPRDFDLWTQVNVGEIWPGPVTPLVWSGVPSIVGTTTRYALRGLNSPVIPEIQWARRLFGRVYYNEGAFARVFSRELGLPASFIDRALGSRRGAGQRGDDRMHPLRIVRRLPFGVRFGLAQLWSARRLAALVPRVDAWVDEYRRHGLDGVDDRELCLRLDAWVERFVAVMSVNTRVSVSAIAGFGLLARLSGPDGAHSTHDLMTGLPRMRSVAIGAALAGMARWLSDAGLAGVVLDHEPADALRLLRGRTDAEPFLDLFEEFLRRHGHHCPNEGEWLHPRWADAPHDVVGVLAGYLRAGSDPYVGARTRAGSRAASERRVAALADLRRGTSAWRWLLFRLLLPRVRRLVLLRDAGKDCYSKLLYPLRHGYAALGERWAGRGWLDRPDDVFFLAVPEVTQIVSAPDPGSAARAAAARVGGRRRAYEYWSGLEAPEVIDADHRPVRQNVPDRAAPGRAGPDLEGLPVSSGRARGPVRVVASAREAGAVRPGDVLVTRATDPGWTPLFPLVAALVVEIGGQLSHTAIVAREYGLPVVANVRHATRRLTTGQVVTVDGTTGRVHVGGTTGDTEE